jgi:hypothetical protein
LTTQYYVPERSHLYTHRRENSKFYKSLCSSSYLFVTEQLSIFLSVALQYYSVTNICSVYRNSNIHAVFSLLETPVLGFCIKQKTLREKTEAKLKNCKRIMEYFVNVAFVLGKFNELPFGFRCHGSGIMRVRSTEWQNMYGVRMCLVFNILCSLTMLSALQMTKILGNVYILM